MTNPNLNNNMLNNQSNNKDSLLDRYYDSVVSNLSQLLTDDTICVSQKSNESESIQVNNRGLSRDSSKINFVCPENSTLECICALIVTHIQESNDLKYIPPSKYSIFNTREHYVPVVEYSPGYILNAIQRLNRVAQIDYEYMMMGVIYMERIFKASNYSLRICSKNWQRILLISMVLASKIWDDFAMSNADYSQIFSNVTLDLLNELEVTLLKLFNYQIQLSPEEYFKLNSQFDNIILSSKLITSLKILQKNIDINNSNLDSTETTSSSIQLCSLSQVSSSKEESPTQYQTITTKVMKQTQFEKSTRTCSIYSTTTASTSTADYDIEYSHDDEQDNNNNYNTNNNSNNNPLDSPPLHSRCYYCQKNQIVASCPYHSVSNQQHHHQQQQQQQNYDQQNRYGSFIKISSSKLSPVYSEAMSHSLTPVDEGHFLSNHYSSFSSSLSPLRRGRSYSDEIVFVKTKKSNNCLDNTIILDKLSNEKDFEIGVKKNNNGNSNNYGEEDESFDIHENRDKRRIFQLVLQLKQNKIHPPQNVSSIQNTNFINQSYDETKSKNSSSFFSNLTSIRNFFSSKKRRSSEPSTHNHSYFHNRVHIETS